MAPDPDRISRFERCASSIQRGTLCGRTFPRSQFLTMFRTGAIPILEYDCILRSAEQVSAVGHTIARHVRSLSGIFGSREQGAPLCPLLLAHGIPAPSRSVVFRASGFLASLAHDATRAVRDLVVSALDGDPAPALVKHLIHSTCGDPVVDGTRSRALQNVLWATPGADVTWRILVKAQADQRSIKFLSSTISGDELSSIPGLRPFLIDHRASLGTLAFLPKRWLELKALVRLRTGFIRSALRKHFPGQAEDARCRLCAGTRTRETMVHFAFHCPAFGPQQGDLASSLAGTAPLAVRIKELLSAGSTATSYRGNPFTAEDRGLLELLFLPLRL